MDINHHMRGAAIAERGKMDFVFMADWASVMNVTDTRIARDKEHAQVKLDPVLACAAVAAVTTHVGLVPTASTTYNHPYNSPGAWPVSTISAAAVWAGTW
ncbi:hypothetical protein ACFQY5_03075 [Paeniroseomonas aquatica]|uniref:hypothetical protein n=1 Tax=Paeniroseomonas aquatica TaxID=373043 RepID=UPI00360CA621